jgi:hypothetical protein
MSKRASQVLQTIKDKADSLADYPATWSKTSGELVPNGRQIQDTLKALSDMRGDIARAELELEALLSWAAEWERKTDKAAANA